MTDDFPTAQRQPAPDDEYLPETWPEDEVYSAESDDPLTFADPHMVQLGLALNFGPGDLACNQDGVLSPVQIARLDTDLREFNWSISAALAVVAFVFGTAGIATGHWSMLFALALPLMGLAAVPAVLLQRERQQLPYRAVLHTTLRIGSRSLAMRRRSIKKKPQLPVSGIKRIFGPKRIYRVLKADQIYIAYYAPVSTWDGYRLLSLEPVDAVPAKTKRKPKRKRRGI